MTLLTVVQDVCAAVGVERPTSVFSNISYNRTMAEMLALANEMAQRIAYDTREWTRLRSLGKCVGDGVAENFVLPADYKRLLLNSNVWRSTTAAYPMQFIVDQDEWTRHRLQGYANSRGEWTLSNGKLFVQPIMAGGVPPDGITDVIAWINSQLYGPSAVARDAADNSIWENKVIHTSPATGTFAQARAANPGYWVPGKLAVFASFIYLNKNCIGLSSGGEGDVFLNDNDTFLLSERVLKLGMIWQWKANKGSPYAEDLGTFNDALAYEAGHDLPAPIIVGRLPISAAARVGYPFPIDPGMVPL